MLDPELQLAFARELPALAGREYPSLRLTHHVFEGETHLSVIPGTISRGLRDVFSPER